MIDFLTINHVLVDDTPLQIMKRTPVLLIYSVTDRISRVELIDEYAHRMREANMDVRTLRLQESAHCMHLVTHRSEYEDAVQQFRDSLSPTSTRDWGTMDRKLMAKARAVASKPPSTVSLD